MGTRSITIIRNAGEEIAVLYRQFDGYPDGMGADIKKALGGKRVVNGCSADDQINGGGDMAVQLVAFLKHNATANPGYGRPKPINSPGGLYLYPAGKRDLGEEFTYTLDCPRIEGLDGRGAVLLRVDGHGEQLYEGPLDAFDPSAVGSDEEDED